MMYKVWAVRPSIVFEMIWSDNTRSYHNKRDLLVISKAFLEASPQLHAKFLAATTVEAEKEAKENNTGDKMIQMLFGVPQPPLLALRA